MDGVTEAQLCNWKLLEHFRTLVLPHLQAAEPTPTEQDPRRKLTSEAYFSLFLFGLLNPIITSLRGLCAASHFQKMRAVSAHPVTLGSFSEAQHLFAPSILAAVVRELSVQAKGRAGFGDPQIRAAVAALTLVDGTVFRAVKRMAWAPAAGHGTAIKLHLHFSAFDQIPTDWLITPGKVCERKALKKMIQSGSFIVGDRYYSEDHLYLKQLQKEGSHFVIRLLGNVIRTPSGPERPLTDEDRSSGVVSDRLEELGGQGGGPVLRVVEIQAQGKVFLLATTRHDLSASQIGLIYRYRWQIELFFKWLKMTLPCHHWLAESPDGVAIQIHCLLIATLLLFLWTGRPPNKRQMEALRFYWMGFIDDAELRVALAAAKNK